MIYRKLGTQDISASVIALGTYPIGGWMWGGTNETDSIKTIHAALDFGINLIDTAPMYGYGLAEKIVGKAIQGHRDKVIVATKCGIVWDTQDWPEGKGELHFYADENGLTSEKTKFRFYRYLKEESVIQEVEASLKRLNTDYIDLLQTHAQDATTPIDETMAALEKLRDQGKIRAIGSSNVDRRQLLAYCKSGTLDSTQEKYSFLDRTSGDNGVLAECETHHVSFLAYSPLEQGLLTGKLDPHRVYSQDDFRKNDARFSPDNVTRLNAELAKLHPLAESCGLSISQLIIAWTVARYQKMHVICGVKNAKQVEENAKAGEFLLSDDQLSEMESLLRFLRIKNTEKSSCV